LASSYNALGMFYSERDAAVARDHFAQARSLLLDTLPPDHPDVLTVSHNLAAIESRLGDWSAAEALERDILAARRRIVGPQSEDVASSLSSLGVYLVFQGRVADARDLFAASLDIFAAVLGPEHAQVGMARYNLGVALALAGEPEKALPQLDRALSTSGVRDDPRNGLIHLTRGHRALVLSMLCRPDEAMVTARQALAMADSPGPSSTPRARADVRLILGVLLLDQGQAREAEQHLREALAIHEELFVAGYPRLAHERCLLAAALAAQGDLPGARALAWANLETARRWGASYPMERGLIARVREEVGVQRRLWARNPAGGS
jgi:tetratricopeptide (TPR) repeat protein